MNEQDLIDRVLSRLESQTVGERLDEADYLAAASRVAAGICAGKPDMGFPPPRPDVAADVVAQAACDVVDRIVARCERRYHSQAWATKAASGTREELGVPVNAVCEDDGQPE